MTLPPEYLAVSDEEIDKTGCFAPVVDVRDPTVTAYHEAGHAVAAIMTGATSIVVSIKRDGHRDDGRPNNPHCGFAETPGEHATQRLRRAIAGIMAEIHVLGRPTMTLESSADRSKFNKDLASLADSAEEQDLLLRALCSEMASTFRRPDVQATVFDIASALLEHEDLEDADLRRIVAATGLRTTLPLIPSNA